MTREDQRIFTRTDGFVALIAALVAFAVYAWTCAPSVTLLDSGEFAVAAQLFGVPHPTGYPIWTILAWLFSLLPLGNAAWQLALFSGVCGAFAVGLCALLIRSTARWLAPDSPRLATVAALALSLAFAFSESMWSQAVIIEVYTLQALLVGLYVAALYIWLRRPEKLAPLYAAIFLFALAFSNHHLVLALAPLPFLVVVLVRRDLFWDLLLASLVTALIAYLAFALLADNPLVIKAAIRLTLLVGAVLVIALVLRRGRLQWRLVVMMPALLAAGLLPYAYMPLASSTNPPMNWGYTRLPEGFYFSINRSQYSGSLSDLSLRVFSKTLGVANTDPASLTADLANPDRLSGLQRLHLWASFFWGKLAASFSLPGVLLFFLALFAALRAPRDLVAARAWIYLLIIAFCLSMALQPVLEGARTDNAGWWLQMPYHTTTNFLFAVVAGLGAFWASRALAHRIPRLAALPALLLLLPLWPLVHVADVASQRNRWFGWQYGRDMLAPLPRGSVVFGGTDPGRFVPTYLILGESMLPPHRRIDPAFDRRDLYILTQNGLADRFYLRYIRDHYSADRPPVTNAFERWLGRDRNYPAEPLVLPTLDEHQQIRQDATAALQNDGKVQDATAVSRALHSAVARWIFERNKAKHRFYVEESFPMVWSYDHAVPDGLLYRLEPEPLPALPPEAIARDFAFWADYIARLQADPNFAKDYDACRSFSRLRLTGANIYQHRKLRAEAERAFRETLVLWPGNLDALLGLTRLLWERGEFDEPIALFDRARAEDPRNPELATKRLLVEGRRRAQLEITEKLAAWRATPTDFDLLARLVELQSQYDLDAELRALLDEATTRLGDQPRFLAFTVRVAEARTDWPRAVTAATRWTELQPQSAEAHYRLARAQYALEKPTEAAAALATSIRLGGLEFRERLFRDPVFRTLKDVPEVQGLMVAPPPAPKTPPINP